jgi:hypothetical protein
VCGLRGCDKPLTEESDSFYFCSSEHMHRWLVDNAGRDQVETITHHRGPAPIVGTRWSLDLVGAIEKAVWLADSDALEDQIRSVRKRCGRGALFESNRVNMHEAAPELEKYLDDQDLWEKPSDNQPMPYYPGGITYG